MDRKNEFKFYVLQEQTFTLEKILQDHHIQFHNELMIGTNARSQKYYINNSDRPLLDKLCKQNEIVLLTDSIPFIEHRLPSLKSNTLVIVLFLLIILIFVFLWLT